MSVFGIAEVVTGFSHNFFGVHTAQVTIATNVGVSIGVPYSVAGLLVLTMKRTAIALALVLLVVVIAGRIAVVVTGLFPTDAVKQTVAITLGTSIAIAFTIYIRIKWNVCR